MDATKLSREVKMKALSVLLFLKEKQTGKIKGEECINGAPQQAYIAKEDATSPTASTESMFVTTAIAANKKRKVRCFNIPSAFVNTDVDKDVLMVLKGEPADMMIQIAPQVYRKYVTINKKGTPILYVDEGEPALLSEITKGTGGLRIHSQSIRSMRSKQDDQMWIAINGYLACGQPYEFMRGQL